MQSLGGRGHSGGLGAGGWLWLNCGYDGVVVQCREVAIAVAQGVRELPASEST